MSRKRATQRRWMVKRTFEPDRLSPATLVQAYGQLVPYHIRVLPLPLSSVEAQAPPDPGAAPPHDPLSSPPLNLIGPQPEPTLVIGSITKKEAA
jgi:hypothetical protein